MLNEDASKDHLIKENEQLKERISLLEGSLSTYSQSNKRIDRYCTILENSINEIYLFDKYSLLFVQVNKAAQNNLGYSMEDLQKMTPLDLKPEFSLREFNNFIEPLRKGDVDKLTFETVHKRKDQSLYNVEIHLQLHNFEDVELFTAFILDITKRKKAEQSIKESKNRFKKLSSLSFEGIVLHNNGIVEDVNLSGVKMFGYTIDEIIGQNVVELLIPENQRQFVYKKMKSKFTFPYESEGIKKDGTIFPIEIEARDVTIGIENKITRVAAVRDITNRKNAEYALQAALEKANESDRLKSAFLATMSHELRTPLNAIIGFSDLVDQDMEIAEIMEVTKIINESGNHLLSIIQDLFDITLIGTGEVKIENDEINVHLFLDNMLNQIKIEQKKLNKNHLDIKLIVPAENQRLIIKTDPTKLKQIFIHLFRNALKFTGTGYIHYGYRLEQNGSKSIVKFYVEDSGIGISEDKLIFIFDEFRQGEETHNRKFEGIGVGLSIAKKLTELLGGEIWCESVVNQGSTFYFSLPEITSN